MPMPSSETIRPAETCTEKEGTKMRYETWAKQATCRGTDTQLFFQDKGGGPYAYREAKEYCAACPVIQKCFEYIMAIEVDPAVPRYGFYAGMTPGQRESYQKQLDKYVSAS